MESEWRKSNRWTETLWRTRIDPQIALLPVPGWTRRFGDPATQRWTVGHVCDNSERGVRPVNNRHEWTIGDDTGPCRSTLLMARKARALASRRQGSWPRRKKRSRKADSLTMCASTVSTTVTVHKNIILMCRHSQRYGGEATLNKKKTAPKLRRRDTGRVLELFNRMLSPNFLIATLFPTNLHACFQEPSLRFFCISLGDWQRS